jgi:ferredoxin
MAKIIQNHEGCIGCGSCVGVCPKFWEMNYEEGKAILKAGKKNEKGEYELEIKNIECNQEAADVCPVSVIKIEQ